jgi:zinc transport system permease protein
LSIFSHGFMINAFAAAGFVSVMAPLVGSVIVLRRLAPVGDALSHAALAGVALGLLLGRSPVMAAAGCAVLAGLLTEWLRRVFPHYAELSTSVITALGVGLAAVISGFVKASGGFSLFLFGSIVALQTSELIASGVMCAVVAAASALLYRPIMYICFDEEGAAAAGVRTGLINVVFTVLAAVTVSVASRAVGALIVSSLLTIPAALSMFVSGSYFMYIVMSLTFSVVFMFAGIFVSYYANLRPGGAVALIGVAALALGVVIRGLIHYARRKKT